jgi:hypothetical protein
LRHSSAHFWHALPQATHSGIFGNLSHCFLQSSQIKATDFASAPTCEELSAASVASASHFQVFVKSRMHIFHFGAGVCLSERLSGGYDRGGSSDSNKFTTLHGLSPSGFSSGFTDADA